MTEAGWTVCIECGMMCEAVEYHPYAACLMFKQCLNSETVRANLQAVRDDSYQQGRVAGLREAEKYALRCLKELQDKIRDLESGKCVLAGAQTKEGVEAWVHAKTLEASRIAKWITARIIEQQAQDEKGVGDGGKTER